MSSSRRIFIARAGSGDPFTHFITSAIDANSLNGDYFAKHPQIRKESLGFRIVSQNEAELLTPANMSEPTFCSRPMLLPSYKFGTGDVYLVAYAETVTVPSGTFLSFLW